MESADFRIAVVGRIRVLRIDHPVREAKRNVFTKARNDISYFAGNLPSASVRTVKYATFFELNDRVVLERSHRVGLILHDHAVAVGGIIRIVAEPDFVNRRCQGESFEIAGGGRAAIGIQKILFCFRERVNMPFAGEVSKRISRKKSKEPDE